MKENEIFRVVEASKNFHLISQNSLIARRLITFNLNVSACQLIPNKSAAS
jgi:hypothetical protein